ncbi:MAG: glycosyltransferase family 39 protein, partial [Hungatella sp.]
HVVFLPMMLTGIYAAFLYFTGYTIRTQWTLHFLQSGQESFQDGWAADFLLGCAGIITLFCLLSAMGVGSIRNLRIALLFLNVLIVAMGLIPWIRRHRTLPHGMTATDWISSLLIVFMVVMVLIQVGRTAISIDFDSLWYGLRSEYILDNGHGIYENMGSVGLVYTYSKGLEVLLLPLSDLASHSYVICFNIWMAVLTLVLVFRIARFYLRRSYAFLAAAMVSSIPAIMNMSITAKTDSMTLLVQLIMILYMLHYLREKQVIYLIISTAAFLLSWTLKPTAVIFSTAIFGMSFLYLLITKQLSLKASWKHWMFLFPALGALVGIWTRTLIMVGIPVTSVFSSIFLKLGFHLKYPFTDLPLYGGEGTGQIFTYLIKTIGKLLLLPIGENMDHVVFAWGTSLLLFLMIAVVLLLFLKKRSLVATSNLIRYAHTVVIPFGVVCLVSLAMLGQIDGNYFMLLYVFIILYGCAAISCVNQQNLRRSMVVMVMPLLLLNVTMTAVSNWAWTIGFTKIQPMNCGYYDHEAQQKKHMETTQPMIWKTLSKDPQTRVIAVGEHPEVFDFPCNMQSYDDVTSAWGNVRLVKTMDLFIEYLHYAKTDYIYMQAETVERDSRCYELMGYLVEAGILKDSFIENGNFLGTVDLAGQYGKEERKAYERYLKDYKAK